MTTAASGLAGLSSRRWATATSPRQDQAWRDSGRAADL